MRVPDLPEAIALDDPEIAVRVAVRRRARRLTLRLDPDGGAVLTVPPAVTLRDVEGFLDRHRGWLSRSLAARPAPVVVGVGASLPVDGVARRVERTGALRGAPKLTGEVLLVPARGAAGPRVAAWLKQRARARLSDLAERYAGELGRRPAAVTVRDTRSRWGSCSAAARLSFSWRLAMAPPEIQAYVAAHEAAHLVEMNHSPAYWAVLGGIMPGFAGPRAWLKAHGRELHRYRFESRA